MNRIRLGRNLDVVISRSREERRDEDGGFLVMRIVCDFIPLSWCINWV